MNKLTKIIFSVFYIFLLIVNYSLANSNYNSQNKSNSHCDLGFGWHFYCDEISYEQKNNRLNKEKENKSEKSYQDYRDELKQIQKELEDRKIRAVMEPTANHLKEYMLYQQEMMEKASQFTDMWKRMVWTNPELDNSIKNPTNTIAKHQWIDSQKEEITQILKNLNKRYGLFFIYRSTCPYCHKYSPVIKQFSKIYSLDVMGISIDKKIINGWEEDTIQDPSVLKAINVNITQVPATILYDNKNKKVIPIGYGILSISELEKRIYFLTKINEEKNENEN